MSNPERYGKLRDYITVMVMTMRITKFNSHRIAFAACAVTVIISLIFALILTVRLIFSPESAFFTAMFLLVQPILSGVMVYLTVFVSLWVYNKIAFYVGYIEFEVD